MSKSTTKRRKARLSKFCGCFHCVGHELPERAERNREWRQYEANA